jgi:tetratricopeptide (TPR) repeat protein
LITENSESGPLQEIPQGEEPQEIPNIETPQETLEPQDTLDANISELEELAEDVPDSQTISEDVIREFEALADEQSDLEGSEREEEPQSFGDLGENLKEFEQLLIEKTDHIKAPQNEEEVPETPPSLEGENAPSEGENQTEPLEEIETNPNEMEDILAQDTAHLDYQKVEENPHGDIHLDGHQIPETQGPSLLDAHSDNFMFQKELKDACDRLVNKGKMHVQKHEFEAAMDCFDKALEIDPQCVDAWGAKGDLMLEMDREDAEE